MSVFIDRKNVSPLFRKPGTAIVRPPSDSQKFGKALEQASLLMNVSIMDVTESKNLVIETLRSVCEDKIGYQRIVEKNLEGMNTKAEVQRYVYNVILAGSGLKVR
jgi:hypothetical protein